MATDASRWPSRRVPQPSTTVPEAGPPTGPPRRAGLFNEVGILREPIRLAARTRTLARAPRGDGRLTITIPGWYAPESSLAPIRGFLGRTGHDAHSWGLGVIRNDVELARDRFVERLDDLVAATGRPAHLVGWSLGGVIARETARERPDLVHRVVTFGTPAIGGPTYTAGADRLGPDECRRIGLLQTALDETNPIDTPITAIFTKRDGVVDWRACVDRHSIDVRHVEVRSTHVGLGVDPDVWQITAHALG
jgi:pimeloyl-ACP methyl ester carboxylesterase